ncbi:MAG: sensor histidine kinase [Faecousia sp.]
MEQIEDLTGMLDLIVQPAFCVQDGTIRQVNFAAQRCLIEVGTPIEKLLQTGRQEYQEFSGGCLYLMLSLSGESWGASVTRMSGFDVFLLEQEDKKEDLQAMALAAQQLRRPLTGIMTLADQLFPMVGVGEDPALADQVARINRNLFQLLRVVSNMSDAYRYTQESASRKETRDICGILEEIFSKSAPLIRHAGIELRYSIPRESVYCLVDAEMLERAVNNILSNAMKFTPKGGRIDAELKRRGQILYLTVQDNGSSVSEKLRGNVFSRFQRGPGLEDSRYGIGLGMVLIRSAAARHGGTVLMEYPKEGGTRITLTVAVQQNKDAIVCSRIMKVDYAGERDHQLIELSDALPAILYESSNIN